MSKNRIERIQMVKAMEYIARQINDEEVFDGWLIDGVADGDIDIEIGNLCVAPEDVEDLDYYIEDEHFADLMHTFLHCMAKAKKSGGLYCDGIVSRNACEPVEPVPFV